MLSLQARQFLCGQYIRGWNGRSFYAGDDARQLLEGKEPTSKHAPLLAVSDYAAFVECCSSFTCNCVGIHTDEVIIDPVGGVADIERRELRTLQDPFEVFRKDPFMILEMARLVSESNYWPTLEMIEAGAYWSYALEREPTFIVFPRLLPILRGDYADQALDLLTRPMQTLWYCWPELRKHKESGNWDKVIADVVTAEKTEAGILQALWGDLKS